MDRRRYGFVAVGLLASYLALPFASSPVRGQDAATPVADDGYCELSEADQVYVSGLVIEGGQMLTISYSDACEPTIEVGPLDPSLLGPGESAAPQHVPVETTETETVNGWLGSRQLQDVGGAATSYSQVCNGYIQVTDALRFISAKTKHYHKWYYDFVKVKGRSTGGSGLVVQEKGSGFYETEGPNFFWYNIQSPPTTPAGAESWVGFEIAGPTGPWEHRWIMWMRANGTCYGTSSYGEARTPAGGLTRAWIAYSPS